MHAGWNSDELDVRTYGALCTPDEMLAAASELQALAAWFAVRPSQKDAQP